jgi:pentatricopeptide repeat protein
MMAPANALFEDMVVSGIEPDLIVFNSLLSGLARQGLVVEAMQMVKRLKADGFRLDATCYKVSFQICRFVCRCFEKPS